MMKKIIKNLLKMYLPRNDHEAQKDYWDSQSSEWRYIAEPFRPSNRELKYYENFLDTVNDKKRILLLGSTPELRDLFARYYNASKIYLCDFSWKMLEETSKENFWFAFRRRNIYNPLAVQKRIHEVCKRVNSRRYK